MHELLPIQKATQALARRRTTFSHSSCTHLWSFFWITSTASPCSFSTVSMPAVRWMPSGLCFPPSSLRQLNPDLYSCGLLTLCLTMWRLSIYRWEGRQKPSAHLKTDRKWSCNLYHTKQQEHFWTEKDKKVQFNTSRTERGRLFSKYFLQQ